MITILHTNDFHGSMGTLPRLTALIERERARDPQALLLDAGDIELNGHNDLSVRIYKALQYDAITPGNVESDKPQQRKAMSRVDAPIVVANIPSNELDFPISPYIIRTVRGKHIGIVGVTTPYSFINTSVYPSSHPLRPPVEQQITISDAVEAIRSYIPQLRNQVDIVVVLSHLGLWKDVQLASSVEGIDLIVGGHSHHRLPSLIRIGSTHIAQAGVGGMYLGVIKVEEMAGTLNFKGNLDPVWQAICDDSHAKSAIQSYIRQDMPEMQEIVGYTEGCWADPWEENAWSNFVTDTLRAHAATDICLYKAGMILPLLDPGAVTLWDVAKSLSLTQYKPPEQEDLVKMWLTGEDIRAICEHFVVGLPYDIDSRIPPDFSLPCNTLLQFSGLRVVFDLTCPERQRVSELFVGDEPLEPQRLYSVVTSSFLAKGYSGFQWFRNGVKSTAAGSVYKVVTTALRKGLQLRPVDGRLTFLSVVNSRP